MSTEQKISRKRLKISRNLNLKSDFEDFFVGASPAPRSITFGSWKHPALFVIIVRTKKQRPTDRLDAIDDQYFDVLKPDIFRYSVSDKQAAMGGQLNVCGLAIVLYTHDRRVVIDANSVNVHIQTHEFTRKFASVCDCVSVGLINPFAIAIKSLNRVLVCVHVCHCVTP